MSDMERKAQVLSHEKRVRVAGETQQSVDACLTIGRSGVYRSGDRHDLDDGQHDGRSVARLSLSRCYWPKVGVWFQVFQFGVEGSNFYDSVARSR